MERRSSSEAALVHYLEARAPEIGALAPDHRAAVLRMAERLHNCNVSPRFIVAAVQSTARLLQVPTTETAANVPPAEEIENPPIEARLVAARQLAEYVQAALHQARAARRSNEIRKMRALLRGIHRGLLCESLGEEGQRLCREIDRTLERLSQPVRRARPRKRCHLP